MSHLTVPHPTSDGHFGRDRIEFYLVQSDLSTLLVRGHQWRAVPVMVLMMLLTANAKVMGQFRVTGVLRFTGWLATAVMAAAVVGMLVTAVL